MQGKEPHPLAGKIQEPLSLSYRVMDTAERQAYFRDLRRLIQAAFSQHPLPKLMAYAGVQLLECLDRLEAAKPYLLPDWSYRINNINRKMITVLGLLYEGYSYHCTYLDFHDAIWAYDYAARDTYGSFGPATKEAQFILDLSNIPPELAALAKGPKGKETPTKEIPTFEVAYGAEIFNRLKRVESLICQIDCMDLSEQETAFIASLHQKLRDVSDGSRRKYSRRKVEKQIMAIEKDIEKFHTQKSEDVLASMRAQTVSLRNQIAVQEQV